MQKAINFISSLFLILTVSCANIPANKSNSVEFLIHTLTIKNENQKNYKQLITLGSENIEHITTILGENESKRSLTKSQADFLNSFYQRELTNEILKISLPDNESSTTVLEFSSLYKNLSADQNIVILKTLENFDIEFSLNTLLLGSILSNKTNISALGVFNFITKRLQSSNDPIVLFLSLGVIYQLLQKSLPNEKDLIANVFYKQQKIESISLKASDLQIKFFKEKNNDLLDEYFSYRIKKITEEKNGIKALLDQIKNKL